MFDGYLEFFLQVGGFRVDDTINGAVECGWHAFFVEELVDFWRERLAHIDSGQRVRAIRTLVDIGITSVLLKVLHHALSLLASLVLLVWRILLAVLVVVLSIALLISLSTFLVLEELFAFFDDVVHDECEGMVRQV
jgi:hypothetical protein